MSERQPHASELIARVGLALYGDEWAAPLARALGVNERTVRRIKAAASACQPYPVAPGFLSDLRALALARSAELGALAASLSQAPPAAP